MATRLTIWSGKQAKETRVLAFPFLHLWFSILGSDINTTADLAGKGASKNYRLFIWLNEAGEDNNAEQGAIFKGTIHVDLPGASGNITGVAAGE